MYLPCDLRDLERAVGDVAPDLDVEHYLWRAQDLDVVLLAVGDEEVLVEEIALPSWIPAIDVVDVDGQVQRALVGLLVPYVELVEAAREAESRDRLGVRHHPQVARLLGTLERPEKEAGDEFYSTKPGG